MKSNYEPAGVSSTFRQLYMEQSPSLASVLSILLCARCEQIVFYAGYGKGISMRGTWVCQMQKAACSLLTPTDFVIRNGFEEFNLEIISWANINQAF